MKDSELRREAHIQKAMSEGICDKCREKVQWRFKFDKYKPLTKPATCQSCKNKTIHKAYRNLCDPCATKRMVCPSCCIEIETSNLELLRVREVSSRKLISLHENGNDNEEFDDEEMDSEDDDIEDLRKKFVKPSSDSCPTSTTMDVEKPQRELEKIAATKYSKSRAPPGSVEDGVFSFSAMKTDSDEVCDHEN